MKKVITMDVILNKKEISIEELTNTPGMFEMAEKIVRQIEKKYDENTIVLVFMSLMFVPDIFDMEEIDTQELKDIAFNTVKEFMSKAGKEIATKRAYEYMHDGFLKSLIETKKEEK